MSLHFTLAAYDSAATHAAQAQREQHPVVVVGAGPVGLALALDLGLRGQPVLLLNAHEGTGPGSRAICFAKRSLEIAHRLGAGGAMLDKGVMWQRGRVYRDRDEVYSFDLLAEAGHRYPAFINLQQPYVERYLMDAIERACADGARITIRGGHRVSRVVQQADDSVSVTVNTIDGDYDLETQWLLACDGARSSVREMLDLRFDGRVFEDNFLIADIKMSADFPTERWFWFEPWFKSGDSALLHKQPDDIWRLDFQLGWDIDRDAERQEDKVRERIDAMLGPGRDYTLDWCSIYTFQCRRMQGFRHQRVVFAGDSAHQVSPFGARGANSGIQDADNLAWKLDFVLRGLASDALIDDYAREREYAADENILHSSRSTDFLTPKTRQSKVFRNAVLDLAKDHAFARPLVNSGRLSLPCVYPDFPDALPNAPACARPGSACPDAPVGERFLLDLLKGTLQLLCIQTRAPASPCCSAGIGISVLHLETASEALRQRYLGEEAGAVYFIRPDQHVLARWAHYNDEALHQTVQRLLHAEAAL